MSYWPFWLSGLALAAVMVSHWFLTERLMAVSGRFSAFINHIRERGREGAEDAAEDADAMTEQELLAALMELTEAEFGPSALDDVDEDEVEDERASVRPPLRTPTPLWLHAVFFGSLALGGFVASLTVGAPGIELGLHGEAFASFFGSGPLSWLVLALGGVLVGFGTRMAGGCTSGHGLCGLSRFQRGSVLATIAFFGAGIVTSLTLGALL